MIEKNIRDLELGDRFFHDSKWWTLRGWHSTVYHVRGEADDGEKRVISRHAKVSMERKPNPEIQGQGNGPSLEPPSALDRPLCDSL